MKKKSKIIIVLGLIALITISLTLYAIYRSTPEEKGLKITEFGLTFKAEMEYHNGLVDDTDLEKRTFQTLDIPKHNPMIYASYEDVFSLLAGGTGIVLFGYPTCPWTRNFVPVLIDAATSFGVEEILYLNILQDRDEKELDNKGKIETIKEGTPDYYRFIEILSDFLSPYRDLNDDTIKRIYFPTAVFVKEGVPVSIASANDMQNFYARNDGNPYALMNEAEKEVLEGLFTNRFTEILKK